ncbi:uncharacterized protein FTJAE_1593 [Fusarium tjaetaba]|uniref:Non-homologous end-joining factor 1 n=1 Tax=Fusarium tjaetaba TaxID=1567544 RepID=A0A8H5W3D2_9HYPO|nr:uncharacterized protein FTJAE_1593 [Fusarium tjaetaba]KAF5647537.1 hypothetical protein FTJAE_1593 [Fusarium tjaetaba]
MWSESLDRKAIFMRGWNENTSIDPSDTPDNMAKLLGCLNTALDASQAGHNEASIRLDRDSRSDAGEDDLALNITYEIPGLQPLKWPMYLKKLPPSSIATHLVLPLIQAHHTKDVEIEFLTRSLGNKDAVLNKLLDKLEAVGTGMEHVFNALSGKKISRAAAAEKVPGLAPFDRQRWKSGLAYDGDCPNDAESLVQRVFEKGGLQFEPITDSVETPRLDQWWQDFKGASSVAHPPQYKAAAAKDKSPTPQDSEKAHIEQDDDDFQVQSTPPHLLAKGKSTHATKTHFADDASTEGESIASAGSVPPSPGTRRPNKSVRKIGTLGGKKQSTPPLSPIPVQSQAQKKSLSQQHDDSETASESEDDDKPATAGVEKSGPSTPSPPRPAANRSGLGRIGGNKTKHLIEEQPVTLNPEMGEPSTTAVSHRQSKKLGAIGKHKNNTNEVTNTANEDNRRSRTTTKEVTEESRPRETSQERADRRREELKKELEKKAAAGPAKKKRRF